MASRVVKSYAFRLNSDIYFLIGKTATSPSALHYHPRGMSDSVSIKVGKDALWICMKVTRYKLYDCHRVICTESGHHQISTCRKPTTPRKDQTKPNEY